MTDQLVFELPHRTAFGREDFFVAANNQEAVQRIEAWARWQPPLLLLFGAEGCGKTHLAKVWQEQTKAGSFYATDTADAPFLLADDIDEHLNELDEAAFFARLRLLLQPGAGGQRGLLLTAKSLDWWQKVRLPDLRSRLSAVPVVGIYPPDDKLLGALLVKLFADRQLQVNENLIHWLLVRMERSFISAKNIVAQLDEQSAKRNKPITISLAQTLDLF